ncbi:hypothetical protein DN069_26165 [Streptacidiphilus pinicola]|uniref:Uncharacterized protein n=1 Tax=Streptacidiphilus pinicola TaxID=2219663 RepID=A0A2X0ICK6_9ACTN|nr:hypothetical protein DN069_26165 [Streptacidiphilus pinicola]
MAQALLGVQARLVQDQVGEVCAAGDDGDHAGADRAAGGGVGGADVSVEGDAVHQCRGGRGEHLVQGA